jgi:hypothetical protein
LRSRVLLIAVSTVACSQRVVSENERIGARELQGAVDVPGTDGGLPTRGGASPEAEAGVAESDVSSIRDAGSTSSAYSDSGRSAARSEVTREPYQPDSAGAVDAAYVVTADASQRADADIDASGTYSSESVAQTVGETWDGDASQPGDEPEDATILDADASESTAPHEVDTVSSERGASSPPNDPDAEIQDAATDASSMDADAHSSGDAAAVAPLLFSLQIDGARTPLYPSFRPDLTRYSIIATSVDAEVGIVATTNGVPLRINGTTVTAGERFVPPGALPGTELVVEVGEGPDVVRYVVQYLPPNFPELFTTYPNPGSTVEPVYTSILTVDANFIVKLDAWGVPLFYKEFPTRVYDFKKHPGGTLSYAVRLSTTVEGSVQVLLDSEFQELARVSSVGLTDTNEHEFLILPNGNFVFLAYEPATHEISSSGGVENLSVIDSMFQEVTPDQQVVFQWNMWDHFEYSESFYAQRQIDYGHANSIALDLDGNWLLSSRGYSQVVKIHRTSGEVMWRLGGLSSDFTFVDDPYNGFCGQHTASRLENGHILLFDNGRDCDPAILGSRPVRSRAAEYALDEGAMTASLVWSYERDGISAFSQGSAQRLSNGNTLVGWGNGAHKTLATEVTAEGDVVYELTARTKNNIRVGNYRAAKYAD